MKTVIVYYSYGGITKKYSNALAKETQADVYEVDTLKKDHLLEICFWNVQKLLHKNRQPLKMSIWIGLPMKKLFLHFQCGQVFQLRLLIT